VKYNFGELIREIRKKKGLTMREVSQAIGVSESLISQIETNKISPAIDTLLAITEILNIDIEYIFRNYRKAKKPSVVKAGKRKTFAEHEVIYEIISKIDGQCRENAIEGYILTLKPGAKTHDKEYGHTGSELGFILEGSGELIFCGEEYKLNQGDSVSFDSNEPHTFVNSGENILKAFWITTPPKMFISKQ